MISLHQVDTAWILFLYNVVLSFLISSNRLVFQQLISHSKAPGPKSLALGVPSPSIFFILSLTSNSLRLNPTTSCHMQSCANASPLCSVTVFGPICCCSLLFPPRKSVSSKSSSSSPIPARTREQIFHGIK